MKNARAKPQIAAGSLPARSPAQRRSGRPAFPVLAAGGRVRRTVHAAPGSAHAVERHASTRLLAGGFSVDRPARARRPRARRAQLPHSRSAAPRPGHGRQGHGDQGVDQRVRRFRQRTRPGLCRALLRLQEHWLLHRPLGWRHLDRPVPATHAQLQRALPHPQLRRSRLGHAPVQDAPPLAQLSRAQPAAPHRGGSLPPLRTLLRGRPAPGARAGPGRGGQASATAQVDRARLRKTGPHRATATAGQAGSREARGSRDRPARHGETAGRDTRAGFEPTRPLHGRARAPGMRPSRPASRDWTYAARTTPRPWSR